MKTLAQISPDLAAAIEAGAQALVALAAAGRDYKPLRNLMTGRFKQAVAEAVPTLTAEQIDVLAKQYTLELLERATAIGEATLLAARPPEGTA